MLFALVANRALAPSSKLSAARWASGDVLITGLPATSDDACYRAMDWLLEIRDELEKQVFDNLADLLNLEMDLLFFDTTSTYFVTEEADAHGNAARMRRSAARRATPDSAASWAVSQASRSVSACHCSCSWLRLASDP